MRKLAVCLLVVAMLAITLCSCGESFIPNENADPAAAVNAVFEQYGETVFPGCRVLSSSAADEADRIDEIYIGLYFGSGTDDIDISKFQSYALLETAYMQASTFGIVKLADPEDAETVVTWVKDHFTKVASTFRSYNNREEMIATDVLVKSAGSFVYWCAADSDYRNSVIDAIEAQLSAGSEG